MMPMHPGKARTLTKIGVFGNTAAGNARLGIYRDAGEKPGELLLDAGVVSIAASRREITISQAVEADWHWLAVVLDTATSMISAGSSMQASIGLWCPASVSPSIWSAIYRSFTYGSLPADESASSWTLVHASNMPLLFWR